MRPSNSNNPARNNCDTIVSSGAGALGRLHITSLALPITVVLVITTTDSGEVPGT